MKNAQPNGDHLNNKYLTGRRILITLLIVLGITGLFVSNYIYARNFPGGKFFITQWTATRAVLLESESPYSPNVLYQIQNNGYGRPAMNGEFEFRFNYPYYAMLFFMPASLIKDYPLARAFWMLLLELLVLATFIACLNLSNWKPNMKVGVLLFLFFTTGYHTLKAIIDGNLIIFSTLLIVLVTICIRNKSDEIAGVLLAGLTAQIQYFILPIIAFIWFAVHKRRINIVWFFLGTLTVLIGFSLLFQPNWIREYAQQLWLSIINNPYGSLLLTMSSQFGELGTRIGITLSLVASFLIIFEWFLIRNKSYRSIIWFIFLLMGVSLFSGLPMEIGNIFLLLPGLIFILSVTSNRWPSRGDLVVFIIVVFLFSSTWALYFFQRGMIPGYFETVLYLGLLPLTEIILLYWSKWWIHKPPSMA